MNKLERTTPAAAGIDAKRMEAALKKLAAPRYGVHALLVLKGGKVVAERYREPYRAGEVHSLFSVSKSFTAAAIGFAEQEGLMRLEDFVTDYFPEYLPAHPCENMRKMRIWHLLTLSAGFDAAPDDFKRKYPGAVVNDFPYSYANFQFSDMVDWAKDFLRSYVAEEPGQRFLYSSACTYILSAILQKAAGQRLEEYLAPRLFAPLGFSRVSWQECSQGRNVGGWGMSLSAEDLAKFAQLLLQKGVWEGRQLLSADYIARMTSPQIRIGNRSAKWEKHFGYQVWILGEDGDYAGIGAFGQMYVVFPAQDAVFVMLGGSRAYMRALDVLLGDLKEALCGGGDAEDTLPFPAAGELPQLYLPDGVSSWDMPLAQQFSGKRYVFSPNLFEITGMQFQFGAEDSLRLEVAGESTELKIGAGYWEYGKTAVRETPQTDTHTQLLFSRVACAGAWEGEVYHLVLAFYETCYVLELFCTFYNHGLSVRTRRNVGFVADADTTLLGMRV